MKARSAFFLYLRMFRQFKVFCKIFPLTLAVIGVASMSPMLFRWYAGKVAQSDGASLSYFVGIIFGALLFRILAWALFEAVGMWESKSIHDAMVRGLSRTRTTFFDENHSGKILNRLIRDFDEVRSHAIIFCGDIINALIELLSIAVVAAWVTPWALVLIVPMLGAFIYILNDRFVMIQLVRTELAKSSGRILARSTDLIDGRDEIRLYGKAEALLSRVKSEVKRFIGASVLLGRIEAWSNFWILSLAEVYAFVVMICLVTGTVSLDQAMTGVVLTAVLGAASSLGWLNFASEIVAESSAHLKRVFEYVDLPMEESEENAVSQSRQKRHSVRDLIGDIEFSGYSMSYRPDSDCVLRKISFRVPRGSKTALVGRTGSGKSSIVQSLLRMVTVRGGDIRMAGRSIFDYEIREFRGLFGVVPQDPHLFRGRIRENLDRLGTQSEGSLREALEIVGLSHLGLDDEVAERGNNFSMGERQLLCLARVVSARKPFVLLDEPTSHLDLETDRKMVQALKEISVNRTLISIAHRRESILNYDQYVEMSDGEVRSVSTFLQARRDLDIEVSYTDLQ